MSKKDSVLSPKSGSTDTRKQKVEKKSDRVKIKVQDLITIDPVQEFPDYNKEAQQELYKEQCVWLKWFETGLTNENLNSQFITTGNQEITVGKGIKEIRKMYNYY